MKKTITITGSLNEIGDWRSDLTAKLALIDFAGFYRHNLLTPDEWERFIQIVNTRLALTPDDIHLVEQKWVFMFLLVAQFMPAHVDDVHCIEVVSLVVDEIMKMMDHYRLPVNLENIGIMFILDLYAAIPYVDDARTLLYKMVNDTFSLPEAVIHQAVTITAQ